jgi:hypothetical protein
MLNAREAQRKIREKNGFFECFSAALTRFSRQKQGRGLSTNAFRGFCPFFVLLLAFRTPEKVSAHKKETKTPALCAKSTNKASTVFKIESTH